jgi:predicted Zn-dependent peptidase
MFDPYDNFELKTLENGLRVFVLHEPNRSFVKLDIVIEVGGTHEPYLLPGIAHVTEHMVCRNTGLSVGELDDRFASEGGYFNAATTENYTQYGFSAPITSSELTAYLKLLYQACFGQLSTDALEEERKVILQEFHTRFPTDKHIAFRERMHNVLYAGSPLSKGIPVIGTKQVLRSVTASDIVAFHSANYTPANTFVVCVGGWDADTVVKNLSSIGLGLLQKVDKTSSYKNWFPQNPSLSRIEEDFSVGEKSNASLTAFVNVEGDQSLAPIIGSMFNHHLTEELRSKRSLVYEVNASVSTQHPFLTIAYGGNDFKHNHIEEVEGVLDNAIMHLKNKEQLFSSLRRGLLLSYEMADESLAQVSEKAIQDLTRFGSIETTKEAKRKMSPIHFGDILDVLEQITKEKRLIVLEYS